MATSIFTTISKLAREHEAINLGQGFPDFDADPKLIARLAFHARNAHNQYAPPGGVGVLVEAIADKIERCHGIRVDAQQEVNITSGATQGLWTAIQSVIEPGDEAIVFEPAYDSYAPAIRSKGGVVQPVVLEAPEFRPDWSRFAERLNDRTRLVVLNNPHNPTGTCWRHEDLLELERQLKGTDVLVLSDEVYEHLVYDDGEHLSVLRYPGLRERAYVTFSFGKTFHVTGWKVGYIIAPPPLMEQFRTLHQFTVFTVNTPAQYAIADYLEEPEHYTSLPEFFSNKRDELYQALEGSRFEMLPSEGSYFCLADYGNISQVSDMRFAERLIKEHGVAVLPISPFYSEAPAQQTLVRLCFAKRSRTLTDAAKRLRAVRTLD